VTAEPAAEPAPEPAARSAARAGGEAPLLRPLDVRPVIHGGAPYFLLRDPLGLTDHQLLVPQPLGALLAFCDGTRDAQAINAAFARTYQAALPQEVVDQLFAMLDEACLLDNSRARRRHAQALQEYRAAPFRTPLLAGAGYPADPDELRRTLDGYLESASGVEPAPVDWGRGAGLLSPHIDYPRGGSVYAHAWRRAAQAAREAELVILLGTDHYGSDPFTPTRQSYATPYGMLPTALPIVDELAAALDTVLGEGAAFAGELRHRGEHSLELVAVWLHHLRAGEPVEFVPLLCGGLQPFVGNGRAPAGDRSIAAALRVLRRAGAGRKTLVIASGDLAHVGPAFGGEPLDRAGRAALKAEDARLLAAMRRGDAEGFFGEIERVGDRNNVCGVAPIYLTMRLLGGLPGEQCGYAVCPADGANTSVVTVSGVFFHAGA
jgi:AmmeMemoRadiSam system protein B